MNTELLAVTKIIDVISGCPRLAPRIDSNDKTPLTDGVIDIYSSPSQATKDFVGRVPVQVKGRKTKKDQKKKKRSSERYSISRVDLNGHVRDSGVLYLVVLIDSETRKRKPYYALLNPFRIQDMLADMEPGQKETSFLLKTLPRDPDKIYDIVNLAYKTREEPRTQVHLDDTLMQSVRELSIFTDGTIDFSQPVTLKIGEQDFSVVFTTAAGVQFPVRGNWEIIPEIYAGQRLDVTISSGKVRFDQPVRRKVDDSTVKLELSPGLSLFIEETEQGHLVKLNITLQSNLGGRLKDLSFLLEVAASSSFLVNDGAVPLSDDMRDDLSELETHYRSLEKLSSLFKYLNADPFLVELDDIDDRRMTQLTMLHQALVESNEVSQDFSTPGRVYQPVGPWGFELFCARGKQDDRWTYYDLFAPDLPFQIISHDENNPEDTWRVTPYEVVDPQDMPKILNLSLANVVRVYEKIGAYDKTTQLANLMVLNFLDAADSSWRRRDEFLSAAQQLNEWTLARAPDDPVHLVNRWQITARKSLFSQEDRKAIRELKRAATKGEYPNSKQIEVSCAILLGDIEDIDFTIENLDESDLQTIQSWPIWTFHKKTNLSHDLHT